MKKKIGWLVLVVSSLFIAGMQPTFLDSFEKNTWALSFYGIAPQSVLTWSIVAAAVAGVMLFSASVTDHNNPHRAISFFVVWMVGAMVIALGTICAWIVASDKPAYYVDALWKPSLYTQPFMVMCFVTSLLATAVGALVAGYITSTPPAANGQVPKEGFFRAGGLWRYKLRSMTDYRAKASPTN